jgi:hypothetical protein
MTTTDPDMDRMIRAHAYSTVHIDAECAVKWHCAHPGEMSIKVSDSKWGLVDVYVTGTRAQIVAWANSIRDQAIRGEEGDTA